MKTHRVPAVTKQALVMLVLMLLSSLGAIALKPVHSAADPAHRVDYEVLIPRSFGTWEQINSGPISIVNPEAQAVLDRIYSQIVTRSYRDTRTGQVVMLSIAYGEDQTKQSQAHRPEVCYPAQGFEVEGRVKDQLHTPVGDIPVMRLVATLGPRHEPITYWIRLGNSVVRGSLEQKIKTVREGFAGRISDGLLFRVSSIAAAPASAYELHDRFVIDLLQAIPAKSRRLFVGQSSGAS